MSKRAPLSILERHEIADAVTRLFAEAHRGDYSAYTNKADFAQGFGMLDACRMLGLIGENEKHEWQHKLEQAGAELARKNGWLK